MSWPRNKATWEISTFEMSSSKGKETAKIWSEGFKVLRFQIWGDKVIWEMSTLEMSSSEQAMTSSRNVRCSFQSFKVSGLRWKSKMRNINIWNVSIQIALNELASGVQNLWIFESLQLRNYSKWEMKITELVWIIKSSHGKVF